MAIVTFLRGWNVQNVYITRSFKLGKVSFGNLVRHQAMLRCTWHITWTYLTPVSTLFLSARFPPDKDPWPAYTVCMSNLSSFLLAYFDDVCAGDFFPPAFNCPHELERIGALGDGGKWVCGLSRVAEKPDCIVYSFGEFLPRLGSMCNPSQIWTKVPIMNHHSRTKSFLVHAIVKYGRSILQTNRAARG